jgi:hypothetical protein
VILLPLSHYACAELCLPLLVLRERTPPSMRAMAISVLPLFTCFAELYVSLTGLCTAHQHSPMREPWRSQCDLVTCIEESCKTSLSLYWCSAPIYVRAMAVLVPIHYDMHTVEVCYYNCPCVIGPLSIRAMAISVAHHHMLSRCKARKVSWHTLPRPSSMFP